MKLLIDTGVLGRVVHPRRYADVRQWFEGAILEHDILISEVADYELRRELLRIGARRSLARLDELGRELRYVPVTTSDWRASASLWAWARRSGRPTAANERLDADVLITAQARAEDAVVLTTNPKHFMPMVQATTWEALAEAASS